jgi:hypothetical protein
MSQSADSGFLGAEGLPTAIRREATTPVYQAYQLLHVAFVVAPIVAGADKFFDLLTNWDAYLAPAVARLLPIGAHGFMMIVGVIEIAAGIFVLLKPKIAAYIVCAWILGIIGNLLIAGQFYDIALRDLGLALAALALARLAPIFDPRGAPSAA